MHIGINFLVARLSDLRVRTLFYFPLDKYYDRAAKKSCQDLNCKNCLEVTHFGMYVLRLKPTVLKNDYHSFAAHSTIGSFPIFCKSRFHEMKFYFWLEVVSPQNSSGSKAQSQLIVSLSFLIVGNVSTADFWTKLDTNKFKVEKCLMSPFILLRHISLYFQKWVILLWKSLN